MSDTSVAVAEVETRRAMLRVWMAISAIWVAFWLCIAALIMTAGEMDAFADQPRLLALIIVAPPLSLLAAGVLFRLIFESRFRRSSNA